MQRRKATGSIAETARATIEPVAALTAALVSFLDGDTEPTARDIYAIEAIADHLRRGLNRHNATMAICSLLDALPLTAGDRQPSRSFYTNPRGNTMKDEERTYFSDQIEELKKSLTTAARLTAALAESMADPIDCTLAELYDAEYIAETLRRTISSPAVFRAICNLTENAILDKDEMQAIGIIAPAADPEKEKANKEVKA